MDFGRSFKISHAFLAILSKLGGFPSKKLHKQHFIHHDYPFQEARGSKFTGKVDITNFQKPTHFQTQHQK
jgi:hypothetical protein